MSGGWVAAEASIIDQESGLAEVWRGWDELAVRAGRPFCSPPGCSPGGATCGPGAPAYKSRLADRQEEIATASLVPRAPSYPLTRAALAPHQLRWALSDRLSPGAKRTLRRAAGR